MIIVLKQGTTQQEIDTVTNAVVARGVSVSPIVGTEMTILGLTGDTSRIDPDQLESFHCVERIMKVAEPFKKANRAFHPAPSEIKIGNTVVGGKKLAIMAGPCSVESNEQITAVAQAVKDAGATVLRGGAFKPRTSPYSFQGLAYEGLDMLCHAREQTGLPIVTELMSPYDIDTFVDKVDCIQVGARNMQNFDLLKQLGKIRKPILLKRGLSATIEEWLLSAEYIMAGGNEQVILCERGIRTFETYTRNTLDLSAICAVKKLSHLPVIVDPSHSTGKSWMVQPIARAAIAVGADGVMIEVHNYARRVCGRDGGYSENRRSCWARGVMMKTPLLMLGRGVFGADFFVYCVSLEQGNAPAGAPKGMKTNEVCGRPLETFGRYLHTFGVLFLF